MWARQRGWLEVDNGDLWEALDGLLRGREPDSVAFVKVKGHAKWSDVHVGTITWAVPRRGVTHLPWGELWNIGIWGQYSIIKAILNL